MQEIQRAIIPFKSLSRHRCCLCFGWSCVKRVQELRSSHPPLKIPFCMRCLSTEASHLKPSKLDSNHEIWAEFNFKRQQDLQATASSLLERPHYRRPFYRSFTERAKNSKPPHTHLHLTSTPQLQVNTSDLRSSSYSNCLVQLMVFHIKLLSWMNVLV